MKKKWKNLHMKQNEKLYQYLSIIWLMKIHIILYKYFKMRKITIIIILLFILPINTFAYINILNFKWTEYEWRNFVNSKFYIPNWLRVLNHSVDLNYSWNYLEVNQMPNILGVVYKNLWENWYNDLLENKLLLIWNYLKNEDIKEKILYKNDLTSFRQSIKIKWIQNIDKVFKWEIIDPSIWNWYIWQIKIDYPQLVVFDEMLLPQNIKAYFTYTKETFNNWNHIVKETEEIKSNVKYEIYKLPEMHENLKNVIAIVPYIEFEIPFSKIDRSNINIDEIVLNIDYDIINKIYTEHYNTNIQFIKEWEKVSPIEFINY